MENAVYNSPMHLCPVCKQYVALDQSAKECAAEHVCTADPCPLAHLFTQRNTTSDKQPQNTDKVETKPRTP